MPAKWQTWWPRRIDAWHGSTFVQYSHPVARSGYADLLDRQWQTDDCTIPDDAQELSEMSGLGAELWEIYGPRILRKFELIAPGKRRNAVLFKEWLEAKRVYESRQKSAHETNVIRREKAAAKLARQVARDGDRTVTATVSRHRDRDKEVQEQKQRQKLPPTPTASRRGIEAADQVAEASPPTSSPRASAAAAMPNGQAPAIAASGGSPALAKSEHKTKHSETGAAALAEGRNDVSHVAGRTASMAGHGGAGGNGKNSGVGPSKEVQRAEQCKSEVLAYWRGQNPKQPKCPWGKAEDRALGALLRASPDLTSKTLHELLVSRAHSEVNPAALPHKWLRSIQEFGAGSLGKYGKPLPEARKY